MDMLLDKYLAVQWKLLLSAQGFTSAGFWRSTQITWNCDSYIFFVVITFLQIPCFKFILTLRFHRACHNHIRAAIRSLELIVAVIDNIFPPGCTTARFSSFSEAALLSAKNNTYWLYFWWKRTAAVSVYTKQIEPHRTADSYAVGQSDPFCYPRRGCWWAGANPSRQWVTGRKFIIKLQYRDKQPFTLTFTCMGNLGSPCTSSNSHN